MPPAPVPGVPSIVPAVVCWCGTVAEPEFSADYARCPNCETLVGRAPVGGDISRVEDDERDFYGRNYYLHHVQETNGLPDLESRARTDLTERCLHWLRTFLRFVPRPGARVLELGCGHGGFVAMLRWAGFDATGLELSPWLTERLRSWFDVPVLTGRLEDQNLPDGSFDVVVLMDVLEHLPDPRGTMARAARLLQPGGFLLVQTPEYPTAFRDAAALRAAGHPFARMLMPVEHLHLFSRDSAGRLMAEVGLPAVRFEPAMFPGYDMFFTASAAPLRELAEANWPGVMGTEDPMGAPAARAVLALLDLDGQTRALAGRFARAEADAGERLTQVEALTALLTGSETDRAERGRQVEQLTTLLNVSEADRAERGRQIELLTGWLKESETDRANRGEHIERLTALLHPATEKAGHPNGA